MDLDKLAYYCQIYLIYSLALLSPPQPSLALKTSLWCGLFCMLNQWLTQGYHCWQLAADTGLVQGLENPSKICRRQILVLPERSVEQFELNILTARSLLHSYMYASTLSMSLY